MKNFLEMNREQSNCTKRGLPVVAISRKASPDFARFSFSFDSQSFQAKHF
jgi:hypothetical protein